MQETDNQFDDGGAPGWRSRHVIDVAPPGSSLRRWWNRTPTWKLMLWAFAIGGLLPWAVLIVGVLGAYWFDVKTGRYP